MELLQLKYFKTVAEIGKISTAAEQLFISAPGLSTSISRLEKELGVRLFERTNNQIFLNEQGRIFLRYVNQVLNTLEYARTELHQSILRKEVHVSIANAIPEMWTTLLTAFYVENPHFTLITTGLGMSQFSKREILSKYTFILAEENDFPEEILHNMNEVELFEDFPAILVHPKHPLANRKSVKLCELQSENIFLGGDDMVLRKMIERMYIECGISLPEANMAAHCIRRRLTEEGIGISFSTMYIGKYDASDLCYVPVENPHGPWRIKMFWHKDRVLTAAEEKFKSFVQNFYVPE